MAPAPELLGHLAGVDLGNSAAGDEVGARAHPGQGKKIIKVFHHHEAADHHGKAVEIVVNSQLGDGDIHPLDGVGGGGTDQFAQQGNLGAGQFLRDKLGDGMEISSVGQQPGGGLQVLRGGGVEVKRAGIFVKPHGHQGGLFRADHQLAALKQIDQDADGGPQWSDMLNLAP